METTLATRLHFFETVSRTCVQTRARTGQTQFSFVVGNFTGHDNSRWNNQPSYTRHSDLRRKANKVGVMGEQSRQRGEQSTRKLASRFPRPKRIRGCQWRGEAFPGTKSNQREGSKPRNRGRNCRQKSSFTNSSTRPRKPRKREARHRVTANIVCMPNLGIRLAFHARRNVTSHRVVKPPRSVQFPRSIRARSKVRVIDNLIAPDSSALFHSIVHGMERKSLSAAITGDLYNFRFDVKSLPQNSP